jgi:Ca-activated chloride channel homolog
MVTLLITVAAMAAVALAEWMHAQRLKRVGYLAFGAAGAPRAWTKFAPLARVLAVGATTWGLLTLLSIGASPLEMVVGKDPRTLHHLVIALDVSPSMHLQDSGTRENISRGDRAREVIRSILDRLDTRRTRVSMIAFYTEAKPVVVDTFDPEVTANILADLPLEHAFLPGPTDLYSSVREAAAIAKDWREGTATLIIVSDGDTLPSSEIPTLPRAYSSVLTLGVGNPTRGQFIDGHTSRQDSQALERLALKLRGRYFNVNSRHLPTGEVMATVSALPPDDKPGVDLRQLAVVAVACGATILAALPLLLALAGCGQRFPQPANIPADTKRTKTKPRDLVQSAYSQTGV